jgi:aryl-alcohol dehydrogenase-like predicted oxidoreductase
VYGCSEETLGRFLAGRRDRWFVATKYSGQPDGLIATAEQQLRRLDIEAIDFYQIHWAPGRDELHLYDELFELKKTGKARFVGVSLSSSSDLDYVLRETDIDGIQIKCSLLDPLPYLDHLAAIAARGLAVLVRSTLREGFLAGKFNSETCFPDPADQRSRLSRSEILENLRLAGHFDFLDTGPGARLLAAARYPLAFPQTSTVLLGTKSAGQAEVNFGSVPAQSLAPELLVRIEAVQRRLGLRSVPVRQRVRSLARSIRRRVKAWSASG